MSRRPSAELRRIVMDRAFDRCEYCQMPQLLVASSHQVDHIVAEKHGRATSEINLALSCSLCNLRKGSDIASLDPETGELMRLFNPRDQSWREHFRFDDGEIKGLPKLAERPFIFFNSIRSNESLKGSS